MKFALKDVKPNPFRDLKLCPLREEKLIALDESIETTEFWDNIVGRKVDGKLEIAFGHHRIEVLRRKYKATDEFNFIVRDLSDAMMLQMMARENSETYRNDMSSVIESVKATVLALAEGKIKPEDMPVGDGGARKDYLRYAPSFVAGKEPAAKLAARPYTALSVAGFLGSIKKNKDSAEAEPQIVAALRVLELEELKIWDATVIHTFRKGDTIPVDTVLRATKDKKTRTDVTMARAAEQQRATAEAAEDLKDRLKRSQADAKRQAEESERIAKERAAATQKEDDEKADRLKTELAEQEEKRKAADKKLKDDRAEWERNRAARAKEKEAIEERAKKELHRAEAQRMSQFKALVDKWEREFTNEHALFEETRAQGRDKRMTTTERSTLLKAIGNAADRADRMKVFINPELGKKK